MAKGGEKEEKRSGESLYWFILWVKEEYVRIAALNE